MTSTGFIAAAAAFAPLIAQEYDAALKLDEDNPRLDSLGYLGNLVALCLAEAPAQSLADLAAKAVVLKIQLPAGPAAGTLWDGASEQERLSWSMADDALRLAAAQWKADPAIGAADAYRQAHAAYNTFEGDDDSPESAALWRALEDAAAAAYRTVPATMQGVRALVETMLSHEAGCPPDRETAVALKTLKESFAEIRA